MSESFVLPEGLRAGPCPTISTAPFWEAAARRHELRGPALHRLRATWFQWTPEWISATAATRSTSSFAPDPRRSPDLQLAAPAWHPGPPGRSREACPYVVDPRRVRRTRTGSAWSATWPTHPRATSRSARRSSPIFEHHDDAEPPVHTRAVADCQRLIPTRRDGRPHRANGENAVSRRSRTASGQPSSPRDRLAAPGSLARSRHWMSSRTAAACPSRSRPSFSTS